MYMSKNILAKKNVSSSKFVKNAKVLDADLKIGSKNRNLLPTNTLRTVEENCRQILEMQDKILSAPAMNGGFTTLLYKVENIEQSQCQLTEKVDQIHHVLYEPDSGLYARIKNVEKNCIPEGSLDGIENDLQEIKVWKVAEEKSYIKEEATIFENDKMLKHHETIINDLKATVDRYNSVGKWLLIFIGGGLLSIIGKLIYGLISGHVQIV